MEYLGDYFQYGAVQINNNLMENGIRPIAIEKKNWLFIDHPNVGQRSAIIYSVPISCARIEIDPDGYLAEIFPIDTRRFNPDQLRDLTPATEWRINYGASAIGKINTTTVSLS